MKTENERTIWYVANVRALVWVGLGRVLGSLFSRSAGIGWGIGQAMWEERWLEKDEAENKQWKFVGRDAYTYPVFHAGPRICLGKEMAFLQMKRVVAGILRRFKVVPALEEGVEPEFVPQLTSKMKGGLPVRIVER